MNPQNPFVLRAQLACAAHELPLAPDDERWFGAGIDDAVRELVHADLLTPRGGKMYWSGQRPPARDVGLRSGSSIEYRLIDEDEERMIGTVDDARVFSAAHPGAVYLHQGRQYRVAKLDMEEHVAWMEPYDDTDEYTQARTETDITIVKEDAFAPLGEAIVHLGDVEVHTQVVGYQRKQVSTNDVIETVPLDLPARTLVTRACWYTVPAEVVEATGISTAQLIGTVHAAEHGLIGMLPLFTICDRWDVGGVSMAMNIANRRADHLRLRRLSRWRGHRRARVRSRAPARARHARTDQRVPVRRRLPVVRPVTEVRELERVSRQGRRDRAAGFDDAGASRSGVARELIRELREFVVRRPLEELVVGARRRCRRFRDDREHRLDRGYRPFPHRLADQGAVRARASTQRGCGSAAAGATGAGAVATGQGGSSAAARFAATATARR